MNSELLNRHPGLEKLSVAGWVMEESANVAAGETLEKTGWPRASEGKKGKKEKANWPEGTRRPRAASWGNQLT